MRRKSSAASRMVHKTIDDLRPATAEQMHRMVERAKKANGGTLPPLRVPFPLPPPGMPKRKPRPPLVGGRIRSAVIAEINRRNLSGYALWKMARKFCPTFPQSAVYEFLRGERAIGLEYVEAILAALSMRLVPPRTSHRRSA